VPSESRALSNHQPGKKTAVCKNKAHTQKQMNDYTSVLSTTSISAAQAPPSPTHSSMLRPFSQTVGTKETSQATSSKCVKEESTRSSTLDEDFSESWHFSNWETIGDNLRSSKSASVCSTNSLYIDLDEFDEDGIDEPAYVIEKKRKSLRTVLRADEDLFQTSLKSLNLSEGNTHDLSLTEDGPLDLSWSERQDDSYEGDFNESVLSFLSSYQDLGAR